MSSQVYSQVPGRSRTAIAGLIVVAIGLATFGSPGRAREPIPSTFAFPSLKGLNYGLPLARDGSWVGTTWLRSDFGFQDHWPDVRDHMSADLDFIQAHHLGQVVRLFIGLDQLMEWDPNRGFSGFRRSSLANFETVLTLFDAHNLRMVAVLYDQEVTSSPGNFRIEALDGRHSTMRTNYLRATQLFLEQFGSRSTVLAWDLFNEAYTSLGPDGNLPMPPAADPVSPHYSNEVVHAFLHELYLIGKQAAPSARFTVSDATLYWNRQLDLWRYSDILDLYDIHIYDDHPSFPDLRGTLDKPFFVGEAGAATLDFHYRDQHIDPGVVRYLLEHAEGAGALAVLVHSISDQNVFPATQDRLTPTGLVLADFTAGRAKTSVWPIVPSGEATVPFVHNQLTDCHTAVSPDRNARPTPKEEQGRSCRLSRSWWT